MQILSTLFGITVTSSTLSDSLTDFQVTFETTSCNGDMGFASVETDSIWRINATDCASPEHPGEKLMNVFVKSTSGLTTYDIFTVTRQEAKHIQTQIRSHNESKSKSLENSAIIHLERD